jgi:hypothetical protein
VNANTVNLDARRLPDSQYNVYQGDSGLGGDANGSRRIVSAASPLAEVQPIIGVDVVGGDAGICGYDYGREWEIGVFRNNKAPRHALTPYPGWSHSQAPPGIGYHLSQRQLVFSTQTRDMPLVYQTADVSGWNQLPCQQLKCGLRNAVTPTSPIPRNNPQHYAFWLYISNVSSRFLRQIQSPPNGSRRVIHLTGDDAFICGQKLL